MNEILKQRCDLMLESLLGPDFAKAWWHSPNKAFGGVTPEGQWMLDHTPVYNYLVKHCNGDYY